MFSKIQSRQDYLGLSLRSLAMQLEVSQISPSLALNGKRESNKPMRKKFSSWLRSPIASQQTNCAPALVDHFINEIASHFAVFVNSNSFVLARYYNV